MASALIGRMKCPECGFEAAHVKRSDKGTVYRYCPVHDCGAQYFPRGERAQSRLVEAMRPEGNAPAPAPVVARRPAPTPDPAPEPTPEPPGTGSDTGPAITPPTPTPAPRRRLGFF